MSRFVTWMLAATFVVMSASGDASAQESSSKGDDEIIKELLARSRLLQDVNFQIPVSLYKEYLRTRDGVVEASPTLVLINSAKWKVSVGEDFQATIVAEISVHAFVPATVAVLPAGVSWQEVKVDDAAAELPAFEGWCRFAAPKSGTYKITATGKLKLDGASGGKLSLACPRSPINCVEFESKLPWRVSAAGAARPIVGDAAAGTKGVIFVPQSDKLQLEISRPGVKFDRAATYSISGDVVWSLEQSVGHFAADVKVNIGGASSESLRLTIPPGADNVKIVGPDVRDFRISGATAEVFLRGAIDGGTRINISGDVSLSSAQSQAIAPIGVADGRWSGGTLTVCGPGDWEMSPIASSGLTPIALAEISPSAGAMMQGTPKMAFGISGASYSLTAETLELKSMELQQTIADLAHYQIFLDYDGSAICKADLEISNRSKQYLKISLPKDAVLMLCSVNEKSQPATPLPTLLPGGRTEYLIPMIRSKASVKGLVSFPVRIVYAFKIPPLVCVSTEKNIPLPALDCPIAYCWTQAYVPNELEITGSSGPYKRVDWFSSQTAVASMEYGRSELAEGYDKGGRLAAPTDRPPEKPREGSIGGGLILSSKNISIAQEPPQEISLTGKSDNDRSQEVPANSRKSVIDSQAIARNYYRIGTDAYERGEYEKAAEYLNKAKSAAPDSQYGGNAAKLLDNMSLLNANAAVSKPTGGASKVAVANVKREMMKGNEDLDRQQNVYIIAGQKAALAGDNAAAARNYRAAAELGKMLVERGADEKEVTARLGQAEQAMQEQSQIQQREVAQLRAVYDSQKAAGQYSDALNTARSINEIAPTISRREMDELAISAAGNDALNAGSSWAANSPPVMNRGYVSTKRPNAPVAPNPVEPDFRDNSLGQANVAVELPKKMGENLDAEIAMKEKTLKELEAKLAKLNERQGPREKLLELKEDMKQLKQRPIDAKQARNQELDEQLQEKEREIAELMASQTRDRSIPAERNINERESSRPSGQTLETMRLNKVATLTERARTRKTEGKYAEAKEIYEEIVKIDPNNLPAKEMVDVLGQFLARSSDGSANRDSTLPEGYVGPRFDISALAPTTPPAKRLEDTSGGTYIEALVPSRDSWTSATAPTPGGVTRSDGFFYRDIAVGGADAGGGGVIGGGGGGATGDLNRISGGKYSDKSISGNYMTYSYGTFGMDFVTSADRAKKSVQANISSWGPYDATAQSSNGQPTTAPSGYGHGAGYAINLPLWPEGADPLKDETRVPRLLEVWNGQAAYIGSSDALLYKAATLSRDGKYDQAKELCDQVLGKDPNNAKAHELAAAIEKNRVRSRSGDVEEANSYIEVREAQIPWYLMLKYDSNWKQIAAQREVLNAPVYNAGTYNDLEFDEDVVVRRQVEQKLRARMQMILNNVSFNDVPLADVFDYFREASELNIYIDWPTLRSAGLNPATKINLRIGDASIEKCFNILMEYLSANRGVNCPIIYEIDYDVIAVTSAVVSLENRSQTKMYDIRDLTLENETANKAVGTMMNNAVPELTEDRNRRGQELANILTNAIGGNNSTQVNYDPKTQKINVIGEAGIQREIANVIENLRATQLPQVQSSMNLWRQSPQSGNVGEDISADDAELRRFVTTNYNWADQFASDGASAVDGRLAATVAKSLRANLGQVAPVRSKNLSLSAAAAADAGAVFNEGVNGVRWALIDDAQLRTLQEMAAKLPMQVAENDTWSPTAVGSRNWLANRWAVSVDGAGEGVNILSVRGNTVSVAHDKKLLIDNGGYLTVIQSGKTVYWRDRADLIPFAPIPADIDIPSRGQLVKFEKTLVSETDEPSITIQYKWKEN